MGRELSGVSLKTCELPRARQAVHDHYCTFSNILRSSTRAVVLKKPRYPLHRTRAESQLQELIVGGAVFSAITAAIVNGFKGEPKVCDLCQGVGGTKCFACDGSGSSEVTPERKPASGGLKRDFMGRLPDPESCRVCGGSGTNLCSKCKGSGYLSSL